MSMRLVRFIRSYLCVLPMIIGAVILSACSFSLAEDILPPPGSEQQLATAEQAETPGGPLYPIVAPDPDNGSATYAEKCAPCHGANGLGDGPRAAQLPVPVPAIGTAEVARTSAPSRWYEIVTQGNLERFMPPFESLSARQKWDVIAYVYSLSQSPEMIDMGMSIYQENCARCHGERGGGDGSEASNLSTSARDFAEQAYMADKSAMDLFTAITQGVAPDMPAYAVELSEEKRWALAGYIRSLTFAPPDQELLQVETPPPGGEETAETVQESTQITQEVTGTVDVQVINGSGGEVPANLPVTLYGFDEMQMAYSQTITNSLGSTYRFEGIEMPAGRAFLAGVEFLGETYGSDVVEADTSAITLTIPVVIYETTSDTSNLKTDRLHILLDFPSEDKVQVIEMHILTNPTNRTLVPEVDGGGVVEFALPEGATNLEFQEGALNERFLKTEKGFADTIRISPGQGRYQVIFAYELPYDKKLEFSKPVGIPVDAVVVLLSEAGVRMKSDSLRDEGLRDVQGISYHVFSGEGIKANSNLTFNLSGRPKLGESSLVGSSSRDNLLLGLGVFAVAMIVAGGWLYLRMRLRKPGAESIQEPAQAAGADRTGGTQDDADTIMDAIIALDDQYQAGKIPEEAYHQRREQLRAKLKDLIE